MAIHSGTLDWEIPWMGSLVATVHGGHKESDVTERRHSLTHSLPPEASPPHS